MTLVSQFNFNERIGDTATSVAGGYVLNGLTGKWTVGGFTGGTITGAIGPAGTLTNWTIVIEATHTVRYGSIENYGNDGDGDPWLNWNQSGIPGPYPPDQFTATIPIPLNQRTTSAWVFSTTDNKVYVNGLLSGTYPNVHTANLTSWGIRSPTDTTVHSVRIFDTALTAAEVAALKPVHLLGEWGFLDNLNDTSGNGHTGTFVPELGGVLTYVTGPQVNTKGIKFGQATNHVDVGHAGLEPAVDGVTTMGWIRIETGSGTSAAGAQVLGIMSKGRATTSDRSVLSANATSGTARVGNGFVRWKNNLVITASCGAWNDNNWHHMAQVDGNTRWAVYLDGVQVANGTRALDNTTAATWEAYPWQIGHDPNDAGFIRADPFMSVSGVRIFQGELTTAEINAWMNTPIALTGGAAQSLSPTAIASTEAFGTATLAIISVTQQFSPTAIASAEAFGTAVLDAPPIPEQQVLPTGITSKLAFGTASVDAPPIPEQTLLPLAIPSVQAFGVGSVDGGAPPVTPPIGVNGARSIELILHRKGTEHFIAADPTDIELIPRTEQIVDGTKRFTPEQPRTTQTFKVIWAGDNGIIREVSPDGGVRRFDFILVGLHTATVAIGDTWRTGDQSFVVEYEYPYNEYEVKVGGVTHGSKPTG